MTKDKEALKKQIENTSGGGQLGGTYYGQEADAKTMSDDKKQGARPRPNDGKK